MSKTNYEEIILSCVSWQEAQRIADELLKNRLINTAEFMEVKAQSFVGSASKEIKEIKLIMRSLVSDFQAIEAEVSKLFGNKDFVLVRNISIEPTIS
jgi:uncharacterized protein involved in tolerance to divalent cations